MGFRWLLGFSQVARGQGDHFAITVSNLWASCYLSVAFMFLLFTFPFFRFTKECLNTSIDTSKKNDDIKNSPRK